MIKTINGKAIPMRPTRNISTLETTKLCKIIGINFKPIKKEALVGPVGPSYTGVLTSKHNLKEQSGYIKDRLRCVSYIEEIGISRGVHSQQKFLMIFGQAKTK